MAKAFFDYQSSTPVLPEALEAMQPFWREVFGTPSSLHQHGLRSRDALDHAREQVAALVNAGSPEEILFTSGGTESANLAVKGVAYASRRRGQHLIMSSVEHPAVTRSVEFLETQGFTCTRIPVDSEGRVEPAQIGDAIREDTILICLHQANHDIGTLQPVAEVGAIAIQRGLPLFVDAVASGGWLEVDVQAMGISLLSLAPHRFFGPKGVGVLYRHRRARLEAVQHGGLQEVERRAGTENVPAIVGAGVAAEVASRDIPRRILHTAQLQKKLWQGIDGNLPHVRLNGPALGPGRLSTNLNLSVEFVEGEGLALMCDVQGIALASGASCVSKTLKASPVMEAIGLPQSLAQSNIILSLCTDNTDQEVDYFLEKFPRVVERLRNMSPTWEEFQEGHLTALTEA